MSRRRVGFARWRADQPSGGNRYDEELATRLPDLGVDLREHPVAGPWPVPSDAERNQFAELLQVEDRWLIGNIVASAAPEAIESAVEVGNHVTVLMHYFPADDPALSAEDRERLWRSEARAVNAASAVVAASAWTGEQVTKRYGRADVTVAEPGVDRVEIASGSAASGSPQLLWLGRVSPTKDPLTFVDALTQIQDLDWTAQLVGPHIDNSLIQEVHNRIQEAGLTDRITVPGPKAGQALEEIWQSSDLLVHTSRSETYGMVITEALAHGIPAVVSDGTGAVDTQGTQAGETFTAGDPDALAKALRTWLTDQEVQASWRVGAIKERENLPTWETTARIVAGALRA